MSYDITITRAAQKALGKLPVKIQDMIASDIEKLVDNPRPNGSIKLEGYEAYRLRVGDFRVVYSINENAKSVVIEAVGDRKEIYRRY